MSGKDERMTHANINTHILSKERYYIGEDRAGAHTSAQVIKMSWMETDGSFLPKT